MKIDGSAITVGSKYKVNGRVYTITKEFNVAECVATAKYITHQFAMVGVRGAARLLEVRKSGTAYTLGWTAGSIAEISSFEKVS